MVQVLVQELPSINDVNRVGGIDSADVFIGTFISRSAVALGITAPLLTTASRKTIGTSHAGEIHAAKEILQVPTPHTNGRAGVEVSGYTPHL